MATYTARTSSSGMLNSPYWYDPALNPFYPTYGLPNCTCYAWGRAYEYLGYWPGGLYTGDAGTWWNNATWQHGSTPKLGAILCLAGGPYSGRGHVAVVEKIYSDGSITCSNSAYDRNPATMAQSYFYLRSGNSGNSWGYSEYTLQGFLYSPVDFDPDIDPGPTPDPPTPGPEPGENYPTRLLLFKKQIYRNQGRLIDNDFYL